MTLPAPNSVLPLFSRIQAMALRHYYLYLGSWPRLVEMMYWPIINIATYGFVSLSILHRFGHVDIMTNAYLAGLMLAEVLTRTIMAIMVMYMEEVWSRNLGHLFSSPLRLRDFVASLFTLSALRCGISITPAYIAVYYLFHFSILSLGWHLPIYAALLCLNGWWFSLLILALLLRFGLAAEWMGWMCTWLLLPFIAPYYPVSVLPQTLQAIAWCLPGTYVFESMKSQIATGFARHDYLWIALALNMLYFALFLMVFRAAFRSAKKSGGLLQMGE